MARSRNIKPSTARNENLADLPPLYRLGFIYSWMFADFQGVIEYRPKRLKADLFPYDDVDIDHFVICLERAGFYRIYSRGERNYIRIENFVIHQNPHKNERDAGSNLPNIDQADVVNEVDIGDSGKDGTRTELGRNKDGTKTEPLVPLPSSFFLIPDSLGQPPAAAPDERMPSVAVATSQAVGFEIAIPTAMRLEEVVPEQFTAEWIEFVKNRMAGFPAAHRNEIQKKIGYWLGDFQTRELPKLETAFGLPKADAFPKIIFPENLIRGSLEDAFPMKHGGFAVPKDPEPELMVFGESECLN